MFIWLTKENINEVDLDSFLKQEEVERNLNTNPFGKYLILKEKEILGYIYYSDIYDRIEINDFKVKDIHKNCGIGNKLLDFFTKTVEKSITLEVREDNMIAIHLYEKYGFKQVALRKNYYQEVDGILMKKEAYN